LLDAEIEADVCDSDPVSALIEAARRHAACAIVIGHEQRSQLRRALGTVTGQLLDSSPVPVVCVPLGVSI
jgi:nucleotide-binding universal stress UspA family protein